ncbi:MAG TPA: lysophospholipid acyltransferase family protein [Methylomirabilota bacterium]|jgi:KDO2-lipid IV(A) lauroyltransferase
MASREPAAARFRPAEGASADGASAAPDYYSHGLNRVAYYRLAAAAAGALPRPARLRVARGLGRLLARAVPAERRAVRANLSRVLAGAPPDRIEAAVSQTFANFGAFFADLLTLNRRPGADLRAYVARADGEHHLDAALAVGRGVVLLTAHLGNWEFAGRLLSTRGGRTAHVVLSAEQDQALEQYLRLDGPQLRFVTRRHATSTLGLLAALRRGELVAMQADRPTGGRGDALAPFFGEPAAFPLGPFVLARAAGAAVIPAFCAMVPGGRYRLEIDPAIWVKPGEEHAALGSVVAALERVIRAYPTQWFNFFDAWSPVHGHA